MPNKYLSFGERFWSKVNVAGDLECWDWLGALQPHGYGWLTKAKHEDRKEALAHRIAWVLCFGEIKGKLEVGHKCANRKCVNPAHLYLTTRLENNREVRMRGNYKFTEQVDPVDLSKAILHARSMNALWKIRNFDFTKLSQEKIIQLYAMINEAPISQVTFASTYKKPQLKVMPCGHDSRFVVQHKEGTAWCVMCEYNEAENILGKIRTLITNDDSNVFMILRPKAHP